MIYGVVSVVVLEEVPVVEVATAVSEETGASTITVLVEVAVPAVLVAT